MNNINWFSKKADRDKKRKREKVGGTSLTVPNQVLSLQEILHRHTNGLGVPYLEGVYDGEIELPDFSMMDNIEKLMFAAEAREELEGQIPREGRSWREYLAHVQNVRREKKVQAEIKAAQEADGNRAKSDGETG